MGGIGSPKHLIENFRALEKAGVDQLIFLHQCGNYRHEDICKSMELFATEVLPQFKERESIRQKEKQDELESSIAAAQHNVKKLGIMEEVPPVEAYPLMWDKLSTETPQSTPDRRPGISAFWQMQVGGKRSKK
jgi:hypothetical protein